MVSFSVGLDKKGSKVQGAGGKNLKNCFVIVNGKVVLFRIESRTNLLMVLNFLIIADVMKKQIINELAQIETAHNVKIIYACESGSRAWGFPSSDSDFDVRFLYLNPTDWYLTVDLERKRDVIELPIDDELDINGWDLRKALKLFHKSNPPLLEWLGSPIIYQEKYSVAQKMRELATTFYNPIACMYHYLHMAHGNHRQYLKGESVRTKKYFYVLRPILAINWLEMGLGVVPTEFEILVDNVVQSNQLRESIKNLIDVKKEGLESDYGPRIPVISDFVDAEIARLENKKFEAQLKKQPVSALNDLFKRALVEVWD